MHNFATEILEGGDDNQGDFAQGAIVQRTINASSGRPASAGGWRSTRSRVSDGGPAAAAADGLGRPRTSGGTWPAAWRRPRPLLDAAVGEAAAAGAQYADVRLSETQELRLYAVSGRAPDERVEGRLGLGGPGAGRRRVGVRLVPLAGRRAALAARLAVRNAAAAAAGSTGAGHPPAPAAGESGRYQTQAR